MILSLLHLQSNCLCTDLGCGDLICTLFCVHCFLPNVKACAKFLCLLLLSEGFVDDEFDVRRQCICLIRRISSIFLD